MNLSKCAQIKESIPIERFLEDLGYGKGKKRGKEIAYHSMIRGEDRTPSFYVNPNKRTWYDHGSGQGGNIIDLAMLLFQTKSIPDIIYKFNQMYGAGILPEIRKPIDTAHVEFEPWHEIKKIRPLGENSALTNYVESRGVKTAAFASDFLKEVYYDYIGEDGRRRPFFGIGWQNVSGGWDIRSSVGKVCILKKDFFLKQGTTAKASVFEGMMNYLSAFSDNPVIQNDTIIVLNSLSLSGRAIEFLRSLQSIDQIHLYLDRGPGGRNYTELFLSAMPSAIDKSGLYEGYDDYNEKIMAVFNSRPEVRSNSYRTR